MQRALDDVASIICRALRTGVSWADAGKVLNEQGGSYLNNSIPLSLSTLTAIEVLSMGFAEVQRSSVLDSELRCYPGGA